MTNGKTLRMRRLFNPKSRRTILYPIDHGVTLGPISGLENVRTAVDVAVGGPVNGIILHKGLITNCLGQLASDRDLGVILHLSASVMLSPYVHEKVIVGTVEEAIRLGVDGISVHVNIGPENDHRMLKSLGRISGECEKYGFPLIAMMYCRKKGEDEFSEKNNKIAARVALELGADIVKVNYTGSPQSFEQVVSCCAVPVIVAGGAPKSTLAEFLADIEGAMHAGAAGIAVGRNVFQSSHPKALLAGLDQMINHKKSAKEVADMIATLTTPHYQNIKVA